MGQVFGADNDKWEPMAARKDGHSCGSGGMVDTAVMQNVKRLVSLTARYANGNRYTVGSSPACRNICQGSSVKKNVRLLRGVNSKFIWLDLRLLADALDRKSTRLNSSHWS